MTMVQMNGGSLSKSKKQQQPQLKQPQQQQQQQNSSRRRRTARKGGRNAVVVAVAAVVAAALCVAVLALTAGRRTFLGNGSIRGTATISGGGGTTAASSSAAAAAVLRTWRRPALPPPPPPVAQGSTTSAAAKTTHLSGSDASAAAAGRSGRYEFFETTACGGVGGGIGDADGTSSDPCLVHFPDSCGSGSADSSSSSICVLTLKGQKSSLQSTSYSELPNQDRSAVIEFGGAKTRNKLFALLDGHGELGHLVSELALMDLPFRVLEDLSKVLPAAPADAVASSSSSATAAAAVISDALTRAFLRADGNPAMSRIAGSGSTAVIVYQHGSAVYAASVGDSTAFVARYDAPPPPPSSSSNRTSTVVLDAPAHKPADPGERARIEAAGGTVMIPSEEELRAGASSRVVLPLLTGDGGDGNDDDGGGGGGGGFFMSSLALAMSRSIGDYEGKKPGYLLAEPAVRWIDLKQQQQQQQQQQRTGDSDSFFFVVAASDGLIDMVPKQEVANLVGRAIAADEAVAGNPAGNSNLRQTCQGLVDRAKLGWSLGTGGTYRDDITIVVSKLEF